MGIDLPSLRGRVTLGFWADLLWDRSPEERREIRAALQAQPLEYYNRLRPATVILEEDVLLAGEDPQMLYGLAVQEANDGLAVQEANDRALILSNRALFLSALTNQNSLIDLIIDMDSRESLSSLVIDAINDLVLLTLSNGSLQCSEFRDSLLALLRLRMGLRTREVSLPAALRIIDRFVLEGNLRDVILQKLVLEEIEPGRRLETSCEIALKINDPGRRNQTLTSLVCLALEQQIPWEDVLKIIQKISPNLQDSYIIALLKKNPTLEPETAIQIALAIKDTALKIQTLKELGRETELSLKTREELYRQIQRFEFYKKKR
jgi:hypothetical protein